uniref:Crystallin gamma N n=1 Tax=Apteryx owenii TaxID=8824 RepID=A0A8B9S4P5_APTOW
MTIMNNPDRLLRGQMLHRRKAGGLRGLRELPGERLPQLAELRLRRERRLDLLRPRRLPRAPVRAGARALPRFPPLERPVGMHGEHYRIEIFEGNRFSGRSLEFTEDCSFLQGRGWDKNYVNAIKAYGDGAEFCLRSAGGINQEFALLAFFITHFVLLHEREER